MSGATTDPTGQEIPSRSAHPGPALGAHLSVAGGLENALQAGVALGCDCIQLFVRNQRQWRAPGLSSDQTARFRAVHRETGLHPVVAHATYLANLGSPDYDTRNRSIGAITDELERCGKLGISYLVLHPGSSMSGTVEAGIEYVIGSLNTIHKRTAGCSAIILLETTAGQGTSIGHRFEQLGAIMAGVAEPDRLGVCLDTCHMFAAGYDFRTASGYAATIAELDGAVGLSTVRCIHMNDSKRDLGSRVDRHEHIGKGKIGKAGFAHFINDKRFAHIPMILETPKGKDGRGTDLDKVNLKRLRALIKP